MFGLVVIEVMTLPGHLSNINEISQNKTFETPRTGPRTRHCMVSISTVPGLVGNAIHANVDEFSDLVCFFLKK